MYERQAVQPMSEGCKEPDWEAQAAQMNKDLDVITNFHASLIEFIEVVGTRSVRRNDGNPLAELLGTVHLDIRERRKRLDAVMGKLEGKST